MADIQEFPKSLFRKDAKPDEKGNFPQKGDHVIVHSREEQEALAGYVEGPEFYAPPKPAKAPKSEK